MHGGLQRIACGAQILLGNRTLGKVIEINESLWRGLSTAARRAKRTPEGVLRGLIRDFLETQTNRDVDQAIAEEACWSRYREADAVRLVRE